MSFVEKTNTDMTTPKKSPFYKKKGWKLSLMATGLILIVAISFVSYMLAVGSQAFEKGLGLSGKMLLKTITGQRETLRGERDDRINILVAGMGGANHPGGRLTDSLMLISYKPSTNQLAMISIPRDTLVPIPGHGSDKINSAFYDGYTDYTNKNCNRKNQGTCESQAIVAGGNLMSETVSKVVDQPIGYFVTMDFGGFEKIIDQLGGVDVYVEKAINDPFFPADNMVNYAPFKISAGQQHLDGKTALKYARSRETSSDFDRAKRQQIILAAVKEKALKVNFLANPKNLVDLMTNLGNSLKTNFTPNELKSFVELAKNVPPDKTINQVLSSGPDGLLIDSNEGTYYLKPKSGDFNQIRKFIGNIFSETISENPKIEIINGSNTNGVGSALAKELEKEGYNVTSISAAATKTKTTAIYDYSKGKNKNTLAFLADKLRVEASEKEKNGQSVDISIIIGDDYAKLISKANGISSQSKD